MRDVIVVGGGLAGLAATAALGGAGYRVRLLESRPFLGGRRGEGRMIAVIVSTLGPHDNDCSLHSRSTFPNPEFSGQLRYFTDAFIMLSIPAP